MKLMMKNFKLINQNEIAKYYDMLYSWLRDYDLEAKFFHRVFSQHNTNINSILDIGCGTGNHILKLQRYGYRITGLDINRKMLLVAQSKISKIPENISLVQGDILNPPFVKNSFDAMYAVFSLVHNFYPFYNLLRFFLNVNRLLKPNGLLILEALNKRNYKKKYPKPKFYYVGSHRWKRCYISMYVYPYFRNNGLLNMNLFHIIRNSKGFELKLQTKHILFMYDIEYLKSVAMRYSLNLVELYGDFNFQPFEEDHSESFIAIFVKRQG